MFILNKPACAGFYSFKQAESFYACSVLHSISSGNFFKTAYLEPADIKPTILEKKRILVPANHYI